MAFQLWRRHATRILLGLFLGFQVDQPREAGLGLQPAARPRVDTAERLLRRTVDGLRRPLLVYQLQQLVWYRG